MIDIIDELDSLKGLELCFYLLMRDGDHKLYKPDPIDDLSIIIREKLDKISDMVRKEYEGYEQKEGFDDALQKKGYDER